MCQNCWSMTSLHSINPPGSHVDLFILPFHRDKIEAPWQEDVYPRPLPQSWDASPLAAMHKGSATLGREGPLKEGMAIHTSILAWRIPCTEEPGWLQSMGLQRVGHDWAIKQQQRCTGQIFVGCTNIVFFFLSVLGSSLASSPGSRISF